MPQHAPARPQDGDSATNADAAIRDATADDASTAIADGAPSADGRVDDGGDAEPVPSGPICPLESGDYAAPGPYAVAELQVDLGTVGEIEHAAATVYHPTPLQTDCRHAILTWGNGTGVDGTEPYAFYHQRAASWGFVVIAPHSDRIAEDGGVQRAAIEYLLRQNGEPGSLFHERLSPKVGSAGHAQGAYAAGQVSKHATILAAVAIDGPVPSDIDVPLLCITGTAALMECVPSVEATSGPAFLASWPGGDHVSTPTVAGFDAMNPGTLQYMRLHTAWFRCFLASDSAACALFAGADACGLCQEQSSGWHELRSRNF